MKKAYKILLTLFCMAIIVSAMVLAVSAADSTEGEQAPKYAILLIGQSNGSGRGFGDTGYTIENEDIVMWDWDGVSGTKDRWVSVLEPQSKNGGGGVPQHASFATSFAEAFEREFGERVGIINAAIGGVAIQTFEPGAVNYINAVNAAKGAVASGTQIVAVLWHQGESNQAYGENKDGPLYDGVYPDYEDVLENLVNSMMKEIGCAPNIPIIAGELPHFPTGSYYISLADQLQKKAETTPNWGFARLDKLTHIGDGIHIDTLSLRILGLRYFKEFYRIYTGEELTKYDSMISDMENTLEPIIKSGKVLNSSGKEGKSTWELDLKTGTLTINCVDGETLPSITTSKDHMKGDFGFYDYRRSINKLVINGYATLTEGVFQDLKYLEEIVIGDSITSVHKDTFKNCPSINTIRLSENAQWAYTLIPFRCSEQLEDMQIIIGDTVHEPVISGDFVLSEDGKTLITVIEEKSSYAIPEGVETILDSAFEGLDTLTSVSFPSTLKTIGSAAFKGCSALKKVVLPEGLTTINANAFANCSSLKVLDMPTTVVSLTDNVVSGCPSLEVIKTGTTSYGSDANATENIGACKQSWMNIFTHSDNVLEEREGYQVVYQKVNSSERYYYVPETLKVIIFAGHTGKTGYITSTPNIPSLEAIVIGDNVKTVRAGAFSGNVNAVVYATSGFSGTLGSEVDGLPVYPTRVADYSVFLGTASTEYTGTNFALGNASASWVTQPTVGATTGRVPMPTADMVNAPAKSTLIGWTDGKVTYKPGSAAYVFENNVTFTAVFVKNYDVTFNSTLAGTTLPENSVTIDTITLPEAPESPDADYGFTGWMVEGTLYQPGDVIDVKALDKDITVTANIVKKFVVSFTGDGVTAEPVKTLGEFKFPAEPENGPVGKTFSGWSADGGETLYQPGDVFTVEADTTYTAIWSTPVTITITGEGMPEDIVITDHALGAPYKLPTLPTTAVIANKAFIGWDNGTTTFAGGAEVAVDETTIFTAVWREGAYQINAGDWTDFRQYFGLTSDGNAVLEAAGLYDSATDTYKGTASGNETLRLGIAVPGRVPNPIVDYLLVGFEDDYNGDAQANASTGGYTIDLVTGEINVKEKHSHTAKPVVALGQNAIEIKTNATAADKKLRVTYSLLVDNVSVENAQLITFNYLYNGNDTSNVYLTVNYTDANGENAASKNILSEGGLEKGTDAWNVLTFNIAGNLDETYKITRITLTLVDYNDRSLNGNGYANYRPSAGETFTMGTATFVPAAMSKIDFYSNDVKLPELTITTKDPFELPAAPETVPEGYYFGGWLADLDGDGDPETYQTGDTVVVMADARFDAKWIKIPTATFVDGENEAAASITNKDEFTLPDCNLTAPENQYFAGWMAEGTNVVLDAGASVTLAEDTVYHAVWKDIPVATFVHKGNIIHTVRDIENTIIPAGPTTDIPTGMQFAYWSADLDGDGKPEEYYEGDTVTIEKDAEFTAVWAELVKINLNSNENNDGGETGTNTEVFRPAGVGFELPLMPDVVIDGAQFLGWSNGTTTFDPGTEITVSDEEETYIAQWFIGTKINPADYPLAKDTEGTAMTEFDHTGNKASGTGPAVYQAGTGYSYQMLGIKGSSIWDSGTSTINLVNGKITAVTRYKFNAGLADTNSDGVVDAFRAQITQNANSASYDVILALQFNLPVESEVPYKNAQLITYSYKYNMNGTYDDKPVLTVTIDGTDYTVTATENLADTNGKWGTLTFDLRSLELEDDALVTNLSLQFVNNNAKNNGSKLAANDEFYFGEVQLTPFPTATVTVKNGETTVDEQTVNAPYMLPEAPEAADNTVYFGGWSDGTTTYEAGAKVLLTKNTTFNAVWLNNFKVTFTSGEASMDIYTHEAFTLPTEAEFEALGITGPAGTEFTGWRSSADGLKYEAGTSVTPTADVTYTAEWLTPYKATFVNNGTEVGSDSSFEPITIPAAPENADASKTFAYWSADVDGDGTPEEYHPNDTVTLVADTTFTAVWGDKITITVNYNDDGATANGTFYVANGEDFELVNITATREGYDLVGWNNGSTIYDPDGIITNITANVAIEAVWKVAEKVLYTDGFTTTTSLGKGAVTDIYSEDSFNYLIKNNNSWTTGEIALEGTGIVTITYVWSGYRPGQTITINGVTIISQTKGASKFTIGDSTSGGTTATLTDAELTANKAIITLNPTTGEVTITAWNNAGDTANATAYISTIPVTSVTILHQNSSGSYNYQSSVQDVKITQ